MTRAIDNLFSKIPVIRSWNPVAKLFLMVALVLLPIVTFIVIVTTPTTEERLCKQRWCVSNIIYKGDAFSPHTISTNRIVIVTQGCEETMQFQDGNLSLPGFDCPSITSSYEIDGDSLIITNASNFKSFYEGRFQVDIYANKIRLTSDSLVIEGTMEPPPMWGIVPTSSF